MSLELRHGMWDALFVSAWITFPGTERVPKEGVCLPLSSPHAELAHQFETRLFEMNCMFASRGRGGATLNHTEGGEGEIDGGCLVLPNARRQLPHRRRGVNEGRFGAGPTDFLMRSYPARSAKISLPFSCLRRCRGWVTHVASHICQCHVYPNH